MLLPEGELSYYYLRILVHRLHFVHRERNSMKALKNLLTFCTFFVMTSIPSFAQTQNTPPPSSKDTAKLSFEDQVQAWYNRRITGLKRPQGWLALVALDWLKEGQNKIESIGTITLTGEVATFQPLPGVHAKIGGVVFTPGALHTEGGKERADRVEIGTRVFTIIKRGERFAVRIWDSDAETLKRFTGIERFPVSADWRVEARWESYNKPKMVKIASVIPDYLEDYPVPGVAIFSIDGKEYRLEPVSEGGESLFFIFADKTNGKETYGAGRFLYTDPPKDGKVVLDFNRAQNPPCAFTPYATCPLPPASNRLPVRIEAGEKNFGDH
jgi:hypothetical protein